MGHKHVLDKTQAICFDMGLHAKKKGGKKARAVCMLTLVVVAQVHKAPNSFALRAQCPSHSEPLQVDDVAG
jgi:hypothetical protein